jgi:hypothetical protein
MDSQSAQGEKQYQEITWQEAKALYALGIRGMELYPEATRIPEAHSRWSTLPFYGYDDPAALDITGPTAKWRIEVE